MQGCRDFSVKPFTPISSTWQPSWAPQPSMVSQCLYSCVTSISRACYMLERERLQREGSEQLFLGAGRFGTSSASIPKMTSQIVVLGSWLYVSVDDGGDTRREAPRKMRQRASYEAGSHHQSSTSPCPWHLGVLGTKLNQPNFCLKFVSETGKGVILKGIISSAP